MREIKFRLMVEFSDIGTGKKTAFVYLSINELLSDISILGKMLSIEEYLRINELLSDIGSILSIDEYTGLKDKNGVEIYEGDIVKRGTTISDVIWDQQHCSFHLRYGREVTDTMKPMEVIGNIYENPKLLEATNGTK